MRETLKRLAKLTAGYSLVTLIGPIFTILLTPLYTRILTPADYGVVDVATALSSLIITFAMFGLDGSMSAYFFDGDESHQRNVVTSAGIMAAASGLIFSIFLFSFSQPLAIWLYRDATRDTIIHILAITVLATPIYFICVNALRLLMNIRRVNVLGLTNLLSQASFTLVFVLALNMKATGIVTATCLTAVVSSVTGLALIYKPLRGQFGAQLSKKLLWIGLSLLPGSIAYLLLSSIDRIILTQYVSLSDQGLYGIANKLASMLFVIGGAGMSAWQPMALSMANEPDAKPKYARVFELIFAAIMFMALALGLFAPEILRIFTRDVYVPAAPYAMVLMAYTGPILFGSSLLAIGLYISKQTKWISVALMVSAATNIALNLLLNPAFGIWGATWATVIAGVLYFAVTLFAAQRAYFVPYKWIRILTLAGCYLLILVLFLSPSLLGSIPAKLIAIVLFVIAIFFTGTLNLQHIRIGAQWAGSMLSRRAA